MLGREVLLEVLADEGVRHVFGNPGTTELPLMDALAVHPELHYVLALQEATVVGMADGYAQATGRPAFCNLHTSAGLGNAIGNLTNARANATPLVVTAGQQDRRHLMADPLLSGDLVALAEPVSKWAHEVRHGDELGTVMRRAFHDAATAPPGPVFVSIPMDVLDQATDAPVPGPSRIERRVVPLPGALTELADLIAETDPERLALVVGDEVAASGAVDAMVAAAEVLGAAVYGSPLYSNLNFPPAHPLWAGMLAPTAAAIASTLSPYRRVLLVGGQAFLVYPFSPGPALPEGVDLLHVSPDPGWIGRAYPTRLGLDGDPRATLEALVPLLRERIDGAQAKARTEAAGDARRRTAEGFEETALSRYEDVPMDPMAAGHALVRALPTDSIVVDEAITTGFYVRGFHHSARPGTYFFCRGGGLGWGMPAACGVSLGRGEPVLCVVGDGSAMYSPQALWTAARERLPVVFAVVNNREYAILRQNLAGRGGDSARTGTFVGMAVDDPPVDFCALARSMGVDATLVEKAPDVGDAVRQALSSGAPHLLELPIASR